jgi:hypothetical protein
MWKSQLQTEIALSSTESKYCGLPYALCDAIPIMELLKEMKRFKFPIHTAKAKVHCKVFEDNSGANVLDTVQSHPVTIFCAKTGAGKPRNVPSIYLKKRF